MAFKLGIMHLGFPHPVVCIYSSFLSIDEYYSEPQTGGLFGCLHFLGITNKATISICIFESGFTERFSV